MEDINPLNVLGKRVVNNLPLHFTKITVQCDSWRVGDKVKEAGDAARGEQGASGHRTG